MPKPKAGEVIVRVHAAGVTPTELGWMPTWTTRAGTPRSFPIVPGHEFSGVVAAIGLDVADVREGDSIYGMNDWFAAGAQAEYCVAPAAWVTPKPRSVDHSAASIIPISALTAWQGLVGRCRVTAGQRVLVHGGAGAVGGFAVQLAHRLGAYVLATASARNINHVRELGANEVLDYHTTRFENVAREVDVVFDTVGGETLSRSWGILNPGGRLVTVASSEEQVVEDRVRAAFLLVEPNRTELIEITRRIDAGELRSVVDAVFPLAAVRAAYEYKQARGKVALRVSD
jgi:NADPH:quinone reductase-like Zn-dependent oxidoreductase